GRGWGLCLPKYFPPGILIPTHHPSTISFHQRVKPKDGHGATEPQIRRPLRIFTSPRSFLTARGEPRSHLSSLGTFRARVRVCACSGTFRLFPGGLRISPVPFVPGHRRVVSSQQRPQFNRAPAESSCDEPDC
ncbi:hypothetical protein INR49_000180, partial [Caranx melampygus]